MAGEGYSVCLPEDFLIPQLHRSNNAINKVKFDKGPNPEWVADALRFLLKFCNGYNPSLYGAHSAKRSNACNASNLGFSVDEVSAKIFFVLETIRGAQSHVNCVFSCLSRSANAFAMIHWSWRTTTPTNKEEILLRFVFVYSPHQPRKQLSKLWQTRLCK